MKQFNFKLLALLLVSVLSVNAWGAGEDNVTFNFGYTNWGKNSSFSGTDYDEVSQTDGTTDIKCTYTRNSGSLYANTSSLRLYKTNTLKFAAPDGVSITKIEFTCTSYQTDITSDVNTCTATSNALSWSGSSQSVTFTRPSNASSYATISSAKVTYTSSGADVITAKNLAATSTTYTNFSGVSKPSGAVYAGNTAKDANGNIQMRAKDNSGIVSTTSGGLIETVSITVGSGTNTVDVYGSNTAYTSAADLYDNSKKGTQLGSASTTGLITLDLSKGDYKYIGIRSNNGSLYLAKIQITWKEAPACEEDPDVANATTDAVDKTSLPTTFTCSSGITTIGANCSIEDYGFVYNTTGAPTLENGTKIQVGTSYATAGMAFSKNVSDISFTCGTKYYVRPYVTNGHNTTYGSQSATFVTPDCLKDYFIDEVQGTEGFTGEGKEMIDTYDPKDVQLDDKERATVGDCPTVHYHFVGWVTALHKSAPTDDNIANITGTATGTTYYAVWAKEAE